MANEQQKQTEKAVSGKRRTAEQIVNDAQRQTPEPAPPAQR